MPKSRAWQALMSVGVFRFFNISVIKIRPIAMIDGVKE